LAPPRTGLSVKPARPRRCCTPFTTTSLGRPRRALTYGNCARSRPCSPIRAASRTPDPVRLLSTARSAIGAEPATFLERRSPTAYGSPGHYCSLLSPRCGRQVPFSSTRSWTRSGESGRPFVDPGVPHLGEPAVDRPTPSTGKFAGPDRPGPRGRGGSAAHVRPRRLAHPSHGPSYGAGLPGGFRRGEGEEAGRNALRRRIDLN